MKFLFTLLAPFCIWVGHCAPVSGAVVGQVHVISIHVPNHAVFDSVFLVLRDLLELPVVYGEPSKPGDKEQQRLYAGFSVGNAYLEPCGPYANDAPFTPDGLARFHGLTFTPAGTLAGALAELDTRNIAHSGAMGSGELPRFLYLSDVRLTGKYQAISLWEIQNTNDHANLPYIRSLLQQTKGGALGVKGIREIRVGYSGQAGLNQWMNLLSPAQSDGNAWIVGNGPVIKLVSAAENQIQAISMEVESIAKAKAALVEKNLAATGSSTSLELDPVKLSGLRILLQQ